MAIETFIASAAGSLFASAAQDLVAVYVQETNQQVFSKARPLKVTVKPASKLMRHPIETNVVPADHRILEPIEIEVSFIVPFPDYRNIYETIFQLFTNGTLLNIQVKAKTYSSFLIEGPPHEESIDSFNALLVGVKFTEVIIVSSQTKKIPRDAKNKNTVDRGTQQPMMPKTNQSFIKERILKGR